MNMTEVKLFRYFCKQADLSKSGIYTCRVKYEDDKTGELKEYENVSVTIRLQKYITEVVKDFASKYNLDYKDLMSIVNRWFHNQMIHKEYNFEDIKDKYWLGIKFDSHHDNKYYNIIPLRTFKLLIRHNEDDIFIPEPSYEYFKPKVSDLEKKYFRFLIRNCVKKKSKYTSEGTYWIKIDDYDKLFKNWTGRTHHTICSKNATRKFIRKWKILGMYSEHDEKALHKKTKVNHFSVLEIDEIKHGKYIRIMPRNIWMELKNKYIKEQTEDALNN